MNIMKHTVFIFLLCSAVIAIALYIDHIKSPEQSIVIGFAGDTMLGRSVSNFLMKLPAQDAALYPWGNVLSLLHATDLNIINLETTLTTHTTAVPKVFNFKADPSLIACLTAARIDAVNIANNHILDFGLEGLTETISTLDAAGIAHVGAGSTIAQARQPVIIIKKGIRIGIIGCTDNEPSWKATEASAGTNYIEIGANNSQLKHDIAQLRKNVDLVILTIHWGPNHRERPSEEFKHFAHTMIEAGVDILHGHSAHLVQGIEIYKKRIIMYDTGDFVDDYAVYEDARNDLSFLFLVSATTRGPATIELVPTAISRMQVNQAEGVDALLSMRRMEKLCAQMGTRISGDGIITIK